jgi:exopolysaccharide biosynthesis WecB/TagA/CpsF family protein
MVFVGLGCPRQEVWAFEYRDALAMPLIAVGAAFDFHAGLLRQAPMYLQRLGLEWLYRLTHEPKRLWQRYLLLNPAYLVLLALQASGMKRFDIASATAPSREIGYG